MISLVIGCCLVLGELGVGVWVGLLVTRVWKSSEILEDWRALTLAEAAAVALDSKEMTWARVTDIRRARAVRAGVVTGR